METNSIQEERELILKFITGSDISKNQWRLPDYENNWSTLMIAVEKIEDVLYESLSDDHRLLNAFYELGLENILFDNSSLKIITNIKLVYQDVLQFVKWYNLNK